MSGPTTVATFAAEVRALVVERDSLRAERDELRQRLATAVASRDQVEGAYELVKRDNLLVAAQMRELYRELEEALDRATTAEQRAERLGVALLATEAQLDEAQLRSIEARNPGIDMDEVRRVRAGRR